MGRRTLLSGAGAAGLALGWGGPAWGLSATPRQRIIIDNDLSGDPDGLFQLAHHLASPSCDVRLVVGSHLHDPEPFDHSATQADNAAAKAREIIALMKLPRRPKVLAGANKAPDFAHPAPTPATAAIIAEAMRDDTTLPLYYCAGAGLTELAMAWKLEPRIGKRLKLVWIGGPEHNELNPTLPVRTDPEYNLTIDAEAVRILFNQSDIEIWQIPRDAYRQMLISHAELRAGLAGAGRLGRYLTASLDRIIAMVAKAPPPHNMGIGETYILGDSPLVTATALQSSFEPDASSSAYVIKPTPMVDAKGFYTPNPGGRPMRVFTRIDTRLTFSDMFAKLTEAAAR
ncbi:nucleoside hydrolase [Novosphingobium sp. FSY-8]|uniref:Nucleoside hydrolase n=2 Tax=Novosphingobium ovatum TaxID=1908523 RepID=A0ABW9XGY7_9SPHN|nr:nucleoside hydrolase [Novosphingobium ovatum]